METEPVLAAAVAPTSAPATDQGQATTYLAGISGVVDADLLRARASALAARLGGARLTVAYPGAEAAHLPPGDHSAGSVDLMTYPLPTAENAGSPWAQTSAAQAALLSLAGEMQAQTVVLVHPDLTALAPEPFLQLASPVHAHQADLVMASYTQGPFDSLLNHSIFAPLTRALYGKRVRFPLAPDLALSPRMVARLSMSAHSGAGSTAHVLWPATVAAGIDALVVEAPLSIHHPSPAGDMELSAVISLLVGSVFAEMEAHAPLWQRVRSAPQLPIQTSNGAGFAGTQPAPAQGIDTAPMVSSFLLGSRSLQDVWGTVLPPVTLLDLKRLTLMAPASFRVPDELWVRILYDFALGYRLRTINRTHLLGALTPLYLGWVASYINEATADPAFQAEARLERLARAFEDGKPYLVRRWRWPDRFNP